MRKEVVPAGRAGFLSKRARMARTTACLFSLVTCISCSGDSALSQWTDKGRELLLDVLK
jgi:hypothetical protein